MKIGVSFGQAIFNALRADARSPPLGLKFKQRSSVMQPQQESKPEAGPGQAAEHVASAYHLLKTLQDRIGEHPEIGQAVHKLEMALAILEVQTGGML